MGESTWRTSSRNILDQLHVVHSFRNTLFSGNLRVIAKTLYTCDTAIGLSAILASFYIDRLKVKVTAFQVQLLLIRSNPLESLRRFDSLQGAHPIFQNPEK